MCRLWGNLRSREWAAAGVLGTSEYRLGKVRAESITTRREDFSMWRVYWFIRWLNPWTWLCFVMAEFCTYRAATWFTASHPYWDRVAGKPQEWSVTKYGHRPQDVFYQLWERRRMYWLGKLFKARKTLEQAERESVRRQYNIQ